MSDERLKPCPFCGMAAKTYQAEHKELGAVFWFVGCDESPSYCPGHLWKFSPLYITEEQAIKIWNERKVD